jgi:uncharacterized protein YdeI (YjbR/CyaY-like superfamily)
MFGLENGFDFDQVRSTVMMSPSTVNTCILQPHLVFNYKMITTRDRLTPHTTRSFVSQREWCIHKRNLHNNAVNSTIEHRSSHHTPLTSDQTLLQTSKNSQPHASKPTDHPHPLPTHPKEMKSLPTLLLPNATTWSTWLATHSTSPPGVTLTLAKKGTTSPTTLSLNEAVVEALCHGWINGQSQKIDDATFSQRFTPRASGSGSGSVWSKRNVGLVEKLEGEGRMRESGRAAVDAAKGDGRWERAYSGAANLDEMRDLVEAIKGSSDGAEAAWGGLRQGDRSQIYFRLAALKTRAGREKNIREYVARLERGEIGDSSAVVPSVMGKTRKRSASEVHEDRVDEERTQIHRTKKTRSGRLSQPPAVP